ncbi:hypothetical protein [Corynebacterium sp. KPL2623]|uniref:hypothetical protein n=1 Tax=Corynebacterium sp. KPL2623 TaxID=3158308 RepID=UPI0032EF13D2
MNNVHQSANTIALGLRAGQNPTEIAEFLQELHLLAPEQKAPHPNPPIDVHKPAWEVPELPNKWVSVFINKIWVTDSHGWGKSMTTDQAHDLAEALLSAINYQESDDE